jgi:hypothetical protein
VLNLSCVFWQRFEAEYSTRRANQASCYGGKESYVGADIVINHAWPQDARKKLLYIGFMITQNEPAVRVAGVEPETPSFAVQNHTVLVLHHGRSPGEQPSQGWDTPLIP